MKASVKVLAAGGVAVLIYLVAWPVSVAPVAWSAPDNPGYTGVFEANERLSQLSFVDLDGRTGPEDAAVGPDGLIYMTSHGGEILRVGADGVVEPFARTGGRPLGLQFGADGTLFVADAYLGLLSVDGAGGVTLLADETEDGSPILYANNVDIAPDGAVYFTDASTRFGAKENGGTLAASVLDLVEHSDNGRVLRYDPVSAKVSVFASGLTFPNGVAVDAPGAAVFVAETGAYRVWRFPLDGGPGEVVLSELPGFPDNLNAGPGGTFWLGLVSPRNAIMDRLSGVQFLRRVIMRLPEAMKPAPTRYGFILRFDAQGTVVETLQDPNGAFALTTGALTMPDGRIVVMSLTEPRLGVLR